MVDKNIPLQRRWIQSSQSTTNSSNGGTFHIISYNILADCYWTPLEKSHPWCPKGLRTARERFPQLMRELEHHKADIICLQEVAFDLYSDLLRPRLSQLGYHGTHRKRGQYEEGVATFFKVKCFELLEEKPLHTHQLIAKVLEEEGARKPIIKAVQTHPYFQRPVLLSRLKCRQSNQILNLGNVHLSWTIKHQDRVLLEVTTVINELIEFAGGVDKPHILCGDINQEAWLPGYQLLQNGCLSRDAVKQMKQHTLPEECDEGSAFLVDVIPERIKHPSKHLKSAYKAVMGDEPIFTNHCDDSIDSDNWPLPSLEKDGQTVPSRGLADMTTSAIHETSSTQTTQSNELKKSSIPTNYDNFEERYSGSVPFISTLDYFWYSSDTLQCKGVLEMVDEAVVSRFHSAPNEVFPSDHMLMKAQFEFV